MFGFFIQAQDLNGEWRVLKSPHSIGQQSSIFKITPNNISVYDFDKFLFKHETRYLDDLTIQVGDTTLLEFEFINGNQNFMKIKRVNGKPTDNLKYVRILETIVKTRDLDTLKKSVFELRLKDKTLTFPLNTKVNLEELLISDSANITSDSISIRKRKETYFLNFYLKGKVTNVFPIKEMNKSKLILYGLPSHQGEVYAYVKE